MLATLLLGVVLGGVSGVFVGWFAIPAFILTLAMDSLSRGGALILTGEQSIFGLPEAFSVIGQGYLGPFPMAAVIMGVVFWRHTSSSRAPSWARTSTPSAAIRRPRASPA